MKLDEKKKDSEEKDFSSFSMARTKPRKFIYPKYLLSANDGSETILGTGNIAVNKICC